MFKKLFIIFIFLFAHPIFSDANQPKDSIRIIKLLPNLLDPLAIDPSLPENFIAGSIDDTPDVATGILWGTPEDLKKIKADANQVDSTFIFVTISTNVSQSGPNEFLGESEFTKELEELGYSDITIEKFKWGAYPVLSLEARNTNKRKEYIAWVGLNTDDQIVLLFHFLYPENEKEPTSEQLNLWVSFLKNSKQLPEKEFQLVYGIDMQEDYTIYSYEKAEIKARSEKLEENGKVLVIVEPLNDSTQFKIKDVKEARLGTDWNCGEPCVKIYGELKYQQDSSTLINEIVIAVLLKTVNAFDQKLIELKEDSSKKVEVYEGNPPLI